MTRWPFIVAALGAGALIGALFAFRIHRFTPSITATPSANESADAGVVAWCAEGLEPIAGGGCLSEPPGTAHPVPLVIYLHGAYDRSTPAEELDRQRRLSARASLHGYAVLALRATEGACHPSVPAFATRYCWPSNEEVADRAGEFVDAWRVALTAAERRVGKGPRYVLGFSSGGFFAGLLAVRALFRADAFVIAHAGPVEPVRALGDKPPILLLSADDDPSQEGMLRLDDELTREGWPHAHSACSGGHALHDEDIEASLGFFTQVREDPRIVRGPSTGHRPQRRELDAAETHPAVGTNANTANANETVRDPTSNVLTQSAK